MSRQHYITYITTLQLSHPAPVQRSSPEDAKPPRSCTEINANNGSSYYLYRFRTLLCSQIDMQALARCYTWSTVCFWAHGFKCCAGPWMLQPCCWLDQQQHSTDCKTSPEFLSMHFANMMFSSCVTFITVQSLYKVSAYTWYTDVENILLCSVVGPMGTDLISSHHNTASVILQHNLQLSWS